MSPITLIFAIALGVAIGTAAAPYVGGLLALIIGVLLVGTTLFFTLILLRASREKVTDGICTYFRSIPKAWNMLISPSQLGDRFSLRRRFDGLIVLLACLIWAVFIGAIVLVIYPT